MRAAVGKCTDKGRLSNRLIRIGRDRLIDFRALSLRAGPQDPVRGELATRLAAVMANGCGEFWAAVVERATTGLVGADLD